MHRVVGELRGNRWAAVIAIEKLLMHAAPRSEQLQKPTGYDDKEAAQQVA